ncbi:MAG: glycosyltransferase family 4 protein [Anaerolineae bacterium]|nr:glycosyltransferase family 4 protein [Candidatus Roseilinea sp.]MDW8451125.1 glycosyltransferase family 4 protein [Anaerolineae bacterium]
MRIAFLCTSGMDNASPRGRWLPIARELARTGHELHLLLLHPTYDKLPANKREQVIEGVRVTHVAQMHVYGLPGERRYFTPAELIKVSLRAAFALRRACVRLCPDIIHVCKPQPINGLAGWLAARQLRRPLFVDCDDYEAEANRTNSAFQRKMLAWWEDRLPLHAQGVTVNTRFLFERCRALGVPEARLRYVPNGADALPAHVPPPPALARLVRQPIVLYVGTLSIASHAVDLLLEAFAKVESQLPEVQLVIVGDGDDRDVLKAQAHRLGLHNVHWLGRLLPDEARRCYVAAYCSVDPVRDTPTMRARSPLKIAESLAAGTPVVTGDVGDRREMLANGEAGVLVQAGDAGTLANGLCYLLANHGRRERMAQHARTKAQAYAWDKLCRQWMEIYEVAAQRQHIREPGAR